MMTVAASGTMKVPPEDNDDDKGNTPAGPQIRQSVVSCGRKRTN